MNKGLRLTFISFFINLALAFIKIMAGYLGNSYALIADGIESFSDVFSSAIVFVGIKVALKAPDSDHPYGHGKAEPLAAMAVGVLLIMAALFIAVESIIKISVPHPLPARYTLVILACVVLVKEVMYRIVLKAGKEVKSSAITADAGHHRSDVITSVAAFIGISIALYFGKGYESADDWAALIAGCIIVYNAIRILRPAFSEIMDEAPPSFMVEEIRTIASGVPGVLDIEKCFIRKTGYEYFVDIHVVVNGSLSVKEGHKIAHDVKDAIKYVKREIYDVLVHIEPDEL